LRGQLFSGFAVRTGAYAVTEDSNNRTPTRLERIGRVSFWTFLVSFGVLIAISGVVLALYQGPRTRPPVGLMVATLVTTLTTFAAGLTYVGAYIFREVGVWKRNHWRFSVMDLVWMMTAIAVALTLILYGLRN